MRYVLIGVVVLLLAIALVSFGGLSVFGVRKEETPAHRSLAKEGPFETRAYPPLVVARVVVDGKYGRATNDAFRLLAGYIFGGNKRREGIAMTAPVFQEKKESSERIAMTAPVFQQQEGEAWAMTFVMPSGRTLEDLPEPLDPRVSLEIAPARVVATIRFAGDLSAANIEAKTEELRAWIAKMGYEAIGEPQSAGYDPPWTVPAMRRNEVLIEIAWTEGS